MPAAGEAVRAAALVEPDLPPVRARGDAGDRNGRAGRLTAIGSTGDCEAIAAFLAPLAALAGRGRDCTSENQAAPTSSDATRSSRPCSAADLPCRPRGRIRSP